MKGIRQQSMSPDKTTKTLVIPTYSVNQQLVNLAYACAMSHKGKVDKIIITEDGGLFSEKLKDLADIYIYNKENEGFSKNVNKGWKLSQTEFTIIANSDTILLEGNLLDVCDYEKVVCPDVVNLDYSGFMGFYFVVSQGVKDKYGILDERMKTFESDMDYFERIKHVFRKEERVKIKHGKAQTLQAIKDNWEEEKQLDARHYRDLVISDYPERINW